MVARKVDVTLLLSLGLRLVLPSANDILISYDSSLASAPKAWKMAKRLNTNFSYLHQCYSNCSLRHGTGPRRFGYRTAD